MAVFGLFGPGDHVITTMLEHNSVLRPLYLLEEAGLELTILPADQNGCICYEDIEKAIRPNTKGIICTHASNPVSYTHLITANAVSKPASRSPAVIFSPSSGVTLTKSPPEV